MPVTRRDSTGIGEASRKLRGAVGIGEASRKLRGAVAFQSILSPLAGRDELGWLSSTSNDLLGLRTMRDPWG